MLFRCSEVRAVNDRGRVQQRFASLRSVLRSRSFEQQRKLVMSVSEVCDPVCSQLQEKNMLSGFSVESFLLRPSTLSMVSTAVISDAYANASIPQGFIDVDGIKRVKFAASVRACVCAEFGSNPLVSP